MTIKEIYKSSRELGPSDKMRLVDLILSDLDKPDLEIEKVLIKEINARRDSVKNGKVKLRSYQQVIGKYK